MISNDHQVKRVSSFREIETSRIEFVSIFNDDGKFSPVIRDQLNQNSIQSLNDIHFLYAFVNMIGREFVIVDLNMRK